MNSIGTVANTALPPRTRYSIFSTDEISHSHHCKETYNTGCYYCQLTYSCAASKRIAINVSGRRFETYLSTLERYPTTLLGDAQKRNQYYDPVRKALLFDRHRDSFDAILYFYQSDGRLRRPENVSLEIFLEEVKFFEITPSAIHHLLHDEGFPEPKRKTPNIPSDSMQFKIWQMFEEPHSSMPARAVALLSMFAVLVSVVGLCIETLPTFRRYRLVNTTNPLIQPRILEDDYPYYWGLLFIIESLCIVWFSIELAIRFTISEKKSRFLLQTMNVVDILAIVPFFVTIGSSLVAIISAEDDHGGSALTMLRLIRLIRVLRIFKLSRHSRGLQVLARTLRTSLGELLLVTFFLSIAIILFSSAVYLLEADSHLVYFRSIPHTFWWAIVTMTTVGYGDDVTTSIIGKLIGSLCAISGVLTIALPVPVIVNNFNYFYQKEKEAAKNKFVQEFWKKKATDDDNLAML